MDADAHSTTGPDVMARLLVSGEYSDLKFRCSDGAELPAHRNMVCLRSSVIAAACNGCFAESTTGVINVADFDSNTVRRMLAFVYTGEYEDGQLNGAGPGAAVIGAATYEESHAALQLAQGRNEGHAASRRSSIIPAAPSTSAAMAAGTSALNPLWLDDDNDDPEDKKPIITGPSDMAPAAADDTLPDADAPEDLASAMLVDVDDESSPVVANVFVYALAEYYDIAPLKAHALDKLLARVALMGGWPADALALALHLATSLVRDGDMLHDLVSAAAVEHAAALVAHPRFCALLRAGGAFAERFAAALAAQREQLDAVGRAHAADAATLRTHLDDGKRRHAAEAASLRAQLVDAQEKLAAERQLRHAAEGAQREHAERCRRCVACSGPAAAAGAGVATAPGPSGRGVQQQQQQQLQQQVQQLQQLQQQLQQQLTGGGRGGHGTIQQQPAVGRGGGHAAGQQQAVAGRGGHGNVQQPGVARGGHAAVQQPLAGRGGPAVVQQPGVGRGGQANAQQGVGRGGQASVQQPAVGRGGQVNAPQQGAARGGLQTGQQSVRGRGRASG